MQKVTICLCAIFKSRGILISRHYTIINFMDKSIFISRLIDVLHIISPDGRERIYQDICAKDSDVYLGQADITFIENQICEKYTNSYFIDLGINWRITTKENLIESELQRASNMWINYLSFLSKYEKHASFVRTLTQILSSNKSLLIL